MALNLTSAFKPSDKKAWQKQVEGEIKKPVSDLYKNRYGQQPLVEPYYSQEEFNPAQASEIARSQKKIPGWLNMPAYSMTDPAQANAKLLTALSGGAQAVLIEIENHNLTQTETDHLLHHIKRTDTPVFFSTAQNPLELWERLDNTTGYKVKGGISYDPLAQWMLHDVTFESHVKDIAELCRKTQNLPDFYPVMVESHVFHNAGASPAQELAFLLGSLAFYLDQLTDAGIPVLHAFRQIGLSVSVGTEYLLEISKLRALRVLHQRMATAYGVSETNAFIHAVTSSFYDADTLPHTNIARATSAALSATIGGCDALTIKPYDHTFSTPTDFSERIARNVSSIISNESYCNQVADPAAGSYYIEKGTWELAESAWKIFLELENQGGILAGIAKGHIQDELDQSWQKKTEAMLHGHILVGVNKYNEGSAIHPDTRHVEREFSKGKRNLPVLNLAHWYTHQH